jgi:hypothetical protein
MVLLLTNVGDIAPVDFINDNDEPIRLGPFQ